MKIRLLSRAGNAGSCIERRGLGMATGHLAHDLKHDRKVALKVLKPELAVGKKDPVTTDVATGISIGTDGWSCVGLSPSSLVSRVSDEVMSDPVAARLEPATP